MKKIIMKNDLTKLISIILVDVIIFWWYILPLPYLGYYPIGIAAILADASCFYYVGKNFYLGIKNCGMQKLSWAVVCVGLPLIWILSFQVVVWVFSYPI